MSDRLPKPDDIPADPRQKYKDQGWNGFGDWLGTGTVAPQDRVYREFEEARAFVHKLGLQDQAEWYLYCKGEFSDRSPKPDDIPSSPHHIYRDDGWSGIGDWLGTGTKHARDRVFRPYIEARAFVHKLQLKSFKEWRQYCKGEFPNKPPKPDDIPTTPDRFYEDKGWSGYGDWLGN